jgi:ABC-2 type transport system permease protein
MLGDADRNLLAAAIVIGLGLPMGFRLEGGVGGVLLAVVLLLGVLVQHRLNLDRTRVSPAGRRARASREPAVGTPLTFATNVFVDSKTMPGWLQAVVDVNPISHPVTAGRGLMHGTAAAGEVARVLLASAALVAVFVPLTVPLYRRRA